MTNDEFLKWLLESENDYRRNVSIERLIRSANFRYKAYMEKIDYTIKHNLDRNQPERLASLDFIRDGQNILITVCTVGGNFPYRTRFAGRFVTQNPRFRTNLILFAGLHHNRERTQLSALPHPGIGTQTIIMKTIDTGSGIISG